MSIGDWTLAALGVLGTGLGAAGGLPGLANLVRELRGKRDSVPPKMRITKECSAHEDHARRLALTEETLQRHGEKMNAMERRFDRRLDAERDERLKGEKENLREQSLTNTRLAEIVGRMNGHAEAAGGVAPASKRQA
jgi:hypothetical protein